MKLVKFAENHLKTKRSLTEYGAESYAAGDLFAFSGRQKFYLNI